MSKKIIASGLSDKAKNTLNSLGFEIIDFHENSSVAKEISHHTDISFLDCGDGTLIIAREMSDYKPVLENVGYNVLILSEYLGEKYPYDVELNCVPMGKYLICNKNTVSPMVLSYFSDRKVIDVNQGYTKCSVIPVNGSAVITDDESIERECLINGLDVLRVSKGSVALCGYDYGFIGGTAGQISENEIAFNGDIYKHSDREKILKFLDKYKIKAVSLTDEQLCDIGGMIVLNGGRFNEKE